MPHRTELLAPATQVYDETEPDEVIILGEKGKRYPKLNWMKVSLQLVDDTCGAYHSCQEALGRLSIIQT